jgi:type I restriction enzyme S subunit
MAGDLEGLDSTMLPRGFNADTEWKWPLSPARELVTLNYGKALKADVRQPGKIPVYGTNGQCGWHDESLATGPGLILGRKGQGPLGVEWCDSNFWVIDTAYYATVLTPNIDLKYLYYLVKYIGLNHLKDGTSNPSLSRDTFGAQLFPVPPLPEQKAIASILGALDDKIELNRRMNATLEAMARALFQSWFVDFDPVRAKLDGRQPAGLDPDTAALFPSSFQDSPLGPIPAGWTIQSLPEMIDFLEGPGLRNWQYRPAGMKFLNIRCITDGDLDVARANSIDLEEFESTYQHFSLQENDIVISTSGTLGRIAIVRTDHLPVMLNTSIIRMRGKNGVGMGFLWGFLQSEYFLSEMYAHAAGSVQLNFGPMHLRKISILRPTNEVLIRFESTVGPLLRKALALKKESRSLALIQDALLPTLLNP